MNLDGKCIIITGGAGGIGISTVKMLLKSGAVVGVVDRDLKKLNFLKELINNDMKEKVYYYNINIGNFDEVQNTVNDFYNKCGSIDGVARAPIFKVSALVEKPTNKNIIAEAVQIVIFLATDNV